MKQEHCDYCKPNPLTLVGKKLLHHGANVQYRKLRVYFENETLERDIYFCPMCGRKIEDDDRIKRPHKDFGISPLMAGFITAFHNKFGTKTTNNTTNGETKNDENKGI